MIKMKIKNGFKSFLYREPSDVVYVDNKTISHSRTLTFKTTSRCLGNHITENGVRCQRQLDESTYSSLEGIIPNPILIKYTPVDKRHTMVEVNLSHPNIDGFEIIEEL